MKTKDSVSRKIKAALSGVCLMSCMLLAPAAPAMAEAAELSLPRPQIAAGMSVMQALEKRQTSRSFGAAALSPSAGIRRPHKPRRLGCPQCRGLCRDGRRDFSLPA